MSEREALIQMRGIVKTFHSEAGEFTALRGIDADFYRGQFVSVVGRSGSGKSTLVNMVTGIDRPTSGTVCIGGTYVHALNESQMSRWRGRNLGIVFQFYQLLPMLSLLENVLLPMDICGVYRPAEREERALALLGLVGLEAVAHERPAQVSGGQQQSAAIARALANDPPLLVADEPTGNLDSRTAEVVFGVFTELAAQGKTILMVTHDDQLARRAQRRLLIADGLIVEDSAAAAPHPTSPEGEGSELHPLPPGEGRVRGQSAWSGTMLRPRWRKVWADLWDNKARTLLVIASIAVGVFATGTIATSYAIISGDMMSSYLAINPPNIKMTTSALQPEEVDIIRRTAGVADAEGRREVIVRVQRESGPPQELKLVAPQDWATWRVETLLHLAGAAVPRDQELILERNALTELGIQVGDTLEIELSDGTRRQLAVVGAAQDPSAGYASILGEIKGYITYDTLEWLHAPLSVNQIVATVAEAPNDRAHIDDVATKIEDRLERAGHDVYYSSTSRQEDYPIKSIIEALIAVLTLLGLLIAFLSGSLIANTMSALLGQHLRQIGVMKLVGARRTQVVAMYLALIMALGLVALLLSIPAAAWAGYRLSAFVADLINFRISDFRIIPLAVALQAFIALLVPPAAGMLPIWGGASTSVKRALTAVGMDGGQAKASRPRRTWRPLRWMSRPLLISLRNTFRRKRRLALTIFTLTLGGAVFIAVFNVQVSLDQKVMQLTRYFLADVNLDFARPYRIEEVTEEVLRVPGVERVEAWGVAQAEWIRGEGLRSENVRILAPPVESALLVPILLHGRWLTPADENAITVNEGFLEEYPGLQTGDTLHLKVGEREADWVIVGIFQYGAMDQLLAYAPDDYLTGWLGTRSRASIYRVVSTDHSLAAQKRLAVALDERFRDLGFDISGSEAGAVTGLHISELLGILTTVLLVLALLTALVGSIGLAGTMSMNVMERTREIGVLRAIGAHDRVVSKLVIVEGLIIGLLSFGFGALVSFPITRVLSEVISQAIFHSPANFGFTSTGFWLWLLVVLALSTVASLMPARNASRLTIREVLAYE